jgi:protein-tyrosine phosphatase
LNILTRANITHIVCAVSEVIGEHATINYLQLDILDTPDANIIQHFDRVCEFIATAIASGGNVLIHW